MKTVEISERGTSNRQYHKNGKPNWWVAWTDKPSGQLNFVSIEKIRADSNLNITVEVPDNAIKVIVGMKGMGKVAEYEV